MRGSLRRVVLGYLSAGGPARGIPRRGARTAGRSRSQRGADDGNAGTEGRPQAVPRTRRGRCAGRQVGRERTEALIKSGRATAFDPSKRGRTMTGWATLEEPHDDWLA